MKKSIALILALIIIVPTLVGCGCVDKSAPIKADVISSDSTARLNAIEKSQEITAYPIEKAYVRGGSEWENLNWREIISKRGINQNNAEPLVIKFQDAMLARRYIYLTFDISDFDSIPYNNVFFKPSFTAINKQGLTYNVYKVDASRWSTDTVTWVTRPTNGELLAENCPAGAFTNVDLTDAVDAALLAGEDKLSIAMIPNKQVGDDENRVDWRATTLTATTSKETPTYVKQLVADDAENKAIWDWAQQLYYDWYARYRILQAQGKPDAELIPIDEKEYAKTIYTTGTGITGYSSTVLETKKWTDADFNRAEPTRTFDSLIGLGEYSDFDKEQKFDKYGGLIDPQMRQEATGFFYTAKIGDRWWVIDPLGYPCYIRSVSGVVMSYLNSPNHQKAAEGKYGSSEKWGISVTRSLKNDWYFNATTSAASNITSVENRLIMQDGLSFVASYGAHIGTNNSNGGNTSFSSNNTMNVFDPEFVVWCDERAKTAVNGKDDEYLLGRTVDNELPIEKTMLYNYLSLSPYDHLSRYSYAAAWTWLVNITGKDAPSEADVTDEILQLFGGFVYDRFYYLASTSIRKYDPNHMVLGSRMLLGFMEQPWILRFAGLHLDCLTLNWYNEWDIPVEDLKFVSENSNIPFMITEFYTKGMDSGLENTRGAGWVVKTQQERGDFYQCYTLRLLECKNAVGWHWFQYIDNDPDPAVIYNTVNGQRVWRDQSSIDANKGIVNNSHEPYNDIVRSMTEINKNVYKLIDHFDAKYAKK